MQDYISNSSTYHNVDPDMLLAMYSLGRSDMQVTEHKMGRTKSYVLYARIDLGCNASLAMFSKHYEEPKLSKQDDPKEENND